MISQQKYKAIGLLELEDPSFDNSLNNQSLGYSTTLLPKTAGLLEYVISIHTPPYNRARGQK